MAPEWMIKKMKRGAKTVEKTTGKDQKDGLTKAIYLLENKCKCFAEDIKIQQEGHLCEEQWFKWCTCLTMAGFPKSAVAFSKASFKHNARSEQRLNELAEQQGKIGMVRCTTFGCSNEEICKCFKKSVCMQNKEHTTSPGSHLLQATKKKKEVDKEELERIGISINKHGNLEDLNGNKFARYILEEVDLIYTPGDQFYLYSDGVYKIIEANLLSRLLRNKLHQFVPDAWTERLEQIYLTALERETTYVESINQNRNYLNLINGLFNLETMELESHRKDVYSSIRIPIKYDSEAKCPRFMQFMDEVLGSDQERIDTLGEYMGYSMTAETRGEKALVLYGKGANGKSVLSNIFIELCGQENVATIPLQD
jgi:putative DNA primase/helicase